MIRSFFAASILFSFSPAFATPNLVKPFEPMVIIQGMEYLGASRFSTVSYCLQQSRAQDSLITDDELEAMEKCMHEHS